MAQLLVELTPVNMEWEIQGEPLEHIPSEPLIKIIYDNAKKNEEAVFLVDPEDDVSYTYGDLMKRATSIAQRLNDMGIGKGDVVTIASENSIQGLSMMIGTWFAGAILNPVNWNLTQREIEIMIEITKPKLVFLNGSKPIVEDAVKEVAANTPILTTDGEEPFLSYDEWLETDGSEFEPDIEDSSTHIFCILFTSGTTGMPKGIQLRDEAMKMVASSSVLGKCKTTFLLTSPMFWVSNIMVISTSTSDLRTLIAPKITSDQDHILDVITKYQPQGWFTGPTLLLNLCENPNLDSYDVSSLEFVTSGGAILLAPQRRYINQKLFNNRIFVRHLYGSTEAGMISAWPEDLEIDSDEYNSVGCVAEGAKLKIVDLATGDTLGPRQEGEICVKTASMLGGMEVLPGHGVVMEFDDEGWFHTGDLGYFDNKQFLYVIGRLKDVMKYSGFQIAPAEIEVFILEHPDVVEVCVVGKPDLTYGDLPAAFIVKRPDSELTEEEMYDFVSERVIDSKNLRGGVYFVDSIPKSAVGKVLRRELQNLLASM